MDITEIKMITTKCSEQLYANKLEKLSLQTARKIVTTKANFKKK